MRLTGGQALARQLVAEGITDVFGIPGVQLDWAVDGLRQLGNQIRYVVPRHEQTTAYMADGFARTTGRIGTCMVVPGPGLLNAMAGYAFAKLRFPGRNRIFGFLLAVLVLPSQVAILPLFLFMRQLGLVGSYWGVILPQVAFNMGFAVVLLQGFFTELPNELFEAAFVDGCSYTRMFWQITLPLSRPILATVGVLALIGSWNEYLLPLVMINSESLYPWPLGIMQYQGQYGTDWGKVLAFVSLTLMPALIFYLMAQKHIIAGLTSGAVKG